MPDCYVTTSLEERLCNAVRSADVVTINGIEFEVSEISIEHEPDVVNHGSGGVDPGVIRIEAEHAVTAAESSEVFDALIAPFDNA